MQFRYICKDCGKEMYSHTEFVRRLGDIYCKECDPEKLGIPCQRVVAQSSLARDSFPGSNCRGTKMYRHVAIA